MSTHHIHTAIPFDPLHAHVITLSPFIAMAKPCNQLVIIFLNAFLKW